MDIMSWIWLCTLVLFLVVEASTVQMVSIWLAGGALVALASSFFVQSPVVQALIFCATSLILLAATRPLARRVIQTNKVATNADANIGREAVVTVAIDNRLGQGQVNIAGQAWTARSTDDTPLPEGTLVRVERIEGVKAMVCAVKPKCP